ncbi:hypothetical protein [Streptomyces broussonetiae]|uniref:Secreted protein n=1 Tax=Streptomyces broussonetiae TaxID=2686304 RepID=A0ABV5EDY7_9ACTN
MSNQTPTPKGLALVLILTGITVALAGALATLATGHRPLMVVAAVGFALQLAGWMAHGRRNGGAA